MEENIELKKKEFNYRGKTLEMLKQMDLREFARLLKSNEKRTVLKQTDDIQKFIIKCNNCRARNKPIKTHARDLVIVPQIVGLKLQVHNGKGFVPVEIIQEMLGHRLGEFAVTRSKVKHGAAGVGATRSSASMSVK